MNISFIELQSWERDILQEKFPGGTFSEEPLTLENVDQFKDTEILSIFIHCNITKEILDKLPKLTYIVTRSTGYDMVDIEACVARNIHVSNVPAYGSNTVAEFTFGLLLDLTRKITQSILQVKELNFDHSRLSGTDLFGKTIGIVGFGAIGRQVLQIAQGFGMKVLVYNHSCDQELASRLHFSYVDIETLMKNADVVTLHLPLTKKTEHIINSENVCNFRKGSFLINTARGGLIDTQAIILGLEQEILAGVGLDVLEDERGLIEEGEVLHAQSEINLKTLLYDHALLHHPKVLITPHNAFNSKEALQRILEIVTENINAFIHQKPQNLVS